MIPQITIVNQQIVRPLLINNRLTVYQKTGFGRRFTFCGEVSAACAVGAPCVYLNGGNAQAWV